MRTVSPNRLTLSLTLSRILPCLLLLASCGEPDSARPLQSDSLDRDPAAAAAPLARPLLPADSIPASPPRKVIPVVKGADYLTGYAVENHAACGVHNLPGVVPEVQGFINGASSHFSQNAFFVNANVWANDFNAASDYYPSGTASGFDGVDAPMVAYLSSHGAAGGNTYYAQMGSPENGGCSVPSDQMRLGNQNLRYLFLSTCQSLKMGPGGGDRPDLPGDSAHATWADAAKGVNCILGYSTTQVDDTRYGSLFWSKYMVSGTQLASTFFDVSNAINLTQIPAVLCFGSNATEARGKLDGMWFSGGPSAAHTSVVRYRMRTPVAPLRPLVAPVTARTLHLMPGGLIDRGLLDKLNAELVEEQRSAAEPGATGERGVTYGDAEAVQIARSMLAERRLIAQEELDALETEGVYSDSELTSTGERQTLRKIVALRQHVAGAPVVSGTHQIRVELDADRKVRRVSDGSRRLVADSAPALTDGPAERERATAAILEQARAQLGGEATLVSLQLGFDLDQADEQGQVPLAYHALVQAARNQPTKQLRIRLPVR